MDRKISAHVDGGLSGGSSIRRPRNEDPHRREQKFIPIASGSRAFPSVCDHFWRMVKMRFGTDELGTDEIGTDGLVNMRLVQPSYAS